MAYLSRPKNLVPWTLDVSKSPQVNISCPVRLNETKADRLCLIASGAAVIYSWVYTYLRTQRDVFTRIDTRFSMLISGKQQSVNVDKDFSSCLCWLVEMLLDYVATSAMTLYCSSLVHHVSGWCFMVLNLASRENTSQTLMNSFTRARTL